jgi:hypothetical protein
LECYFKPEKEPEVTQSHVRRTRWFLNDRNAMIC